MLRHALPAVMVLAGLPLVAHAADAFDTVETVTFRSFHDPGYLIVERESGESLQLWFHYTTISFDGVSLWQTGETLQVGVDREQGSGIFRPGGEAFHKVFFPREHDPIERMKENCLARNESTMGMAQCFAQTYRHLEVDIGYLVEDLTRRTDLDLRPFTESMAAARRAYVTLYGALREERGGTIGTIEQWTTVLPLLYTERDALEALY